MFSTYSLVGLWILLQSVLISNFILYVFSLYVWLLFLWGLLILFILSKNQHFIWLTLHIVVFVWVPLFPTTVSSSLGSLSTSFDYFFDSFWINIRFSIRNALVVFQILRNCGIIITLKFFSLFSSKSYCYVSKPLKAVLT